MLFPGLLLPLHIFEDRYRQLVDDLLAEPEPRRFGVLAIRKGRETGIDGISALYQVGCTATIRQVTEREAGRFDLVTAGTQRFRLVDLDDSRPYLQGQVDLLPDEVGDEGAAAQAAHAGQDAFRRYLSALAARGCDPGRHPGSARRSGPALLPHSRVNDHRTARKAGRCSPRLTRPPADGRALDALPGDHDAAVAHLHSRPGSEVLAV